MKDEEKMKDNIPLNNWKIVEERLKTMPNKMRLGLLSNSIKEVSVPQKAEQKEVLEKLKGIVYGKIDWIQVFKDAYENRKTSWVELGHIQEWRNATDEIMTAFWNQFEEELTKSIKGEDMK